MTDTPVPTEASQRPVVAKEISTPVSGTDTVVIGCKIPQGIVIRAFQKVEKSEATPTGLRAYSQIEGVLGTEFRCEGPAQINHQPKNIVDFMGRNFPGNYALTPGCPRDVWKNWLKWNKGTPLVEEGLIFALGDAADAATEAKSRASIRSGLEPVDPEHPEKVVGRPHRDVSPIQPGVASND
jgi:hypothetical protein